MWISSSCCEKLSGHQVSSCEIVLNLVFIKMLCSDLYYRPYVVNEHGNEGYSRHRLVVKNVLDVFTRTLNVVNFYLYYSF